MALDGPPRAPRPVLRRHLAAADYDEEHRTVPADRTKARGDCVTPADPGRAGGPLFRDCDFGEGASAAALEVSGTGTVALTPGDGAAPSAVEVAAPGCPYDYTTVTTTLDVRGVRDLRVALTGTVRPASITFTR